MSLRHLSSGTGVQVPKPGSKPSQLWRTRGEKQPRLTQPRDAGACRRGAANDIDPFSTRAPTGALKRNRGPRIVVDSNPILFNHRYFVKKPDRFSRKKDFWKERLEGTLRKKKLENSRYDSINSWIGQKVTSVQERNSASERRLLVANQPGL